MTFTATFNARHLLGIEHLKPYEITEILDLADQYVDLNRRQVKRSDTLAGSNPDQYVFRKLDPHAGLF